MFKSDSSVFGITLHIEVRMPILIKVKGYTRVRNGKVEKVHSRGPAGRYRIYRWPAPKGI